MGRSSKHTLLGAEMVRLNATELGPRQQLAAHLPAAAEAQLRAVQARDAALHGSSCQAPECGNANPEGCQGKPGKTNRNPGKPRETQGKIEGTFRKTMSLIPCTYGLVVLLRLPVSGWCVV